MEFTIVGTRCYASAHAFIQDSRGILYDLEELSSLDEATTSNPEVLDLSGLVKGLPATTLPSFINIGAAREREYEVDCYVGRLIGPNEVAFTIKEHPIVSGVAQRDEKMLAVYRAAPPFHTGGACERLPFNYPMGVIEVEVSCEPTGAWLSSAMALTPTYHKLALFFLYTRP